MTRKELKEKIPLTGCVMLFGTNKISKDLLLFLEDGEEVTEVLGAKRKSTVATVLDMVVARFFRSYLVVTDKRLIYIERMKFYKKTLIFDRNASINKVTENSGLQKLSYPYILSAMSQGQACEIAIKEDITQYFLNSPTDIVVNQLNAESQKKFCVFCGQQMERDWLCCPVCGKKAPWLKDRAVCNDEKEGDSSQVLEENIFIPNHNAIIQENHMSKQESDISKQPEKKEIMLTAKWGRLFGKYRETVTTVSINEGKID